MNDAVGVGKAGTMPLETDARRTRMVAQREKFSEKY
jgi:hypothetical protein